MTAAQPALLHAAQPSIQPGNQPGTHNDHQPLRARPRRAARLLNNNQLSPALTTPQTCAGRQHLTRRQTCTEPAAAGLDPPPGHRPGADWFGIRWPPDGYGDTCASYRDEPAPAAQECLYGPSAANADT